MSTAVLEPAVEKTLSAPFAPIEAAVAAPAPKPEEGEFSDPHPLLPVFLAGAVAFILAATFVGSVVAWLFLRNSGVMAP